MLQVAFKEIQDGDEGSREEEDVEKGWEWKKGVEREEGKGNGKK